MTQLEILYVTRSKSSGKINEQPFPKSGKNKITIKASGTV